MGVIKGDTRSLDGPCECVKTMKVYLETLNLGSSNGGFPN